MTQVHQSNSHELASAPPAMRSLAHVLQTYPVELPVGRAMWSARVKGRTALTMMSWPGSVPDAVLVFTVLVGNALQHGLCDACGSPTVLHGRLSTTDAKQLLIDVEDPNPSFPYFSNVRAGAGGGVLAGLLQRHVITDLIYAVHAEGRGKTVRAVLDAGAVEL
ncbi:hypothetical protein ABZ864_40510 [Streptomyces sp. NPDC047082]|uniref:hypothetical protein n=1 Tax=Streptomyces sp. NPDC047082 TaxID=3155259 RepID=UPI0033D0AE45